MSDDLPSTTRIPSTPPQRRGGPDRLAVVAFILAALLIALIAAVLISRPTSTGSDPSATPSQTAGPTGTPAGSSAPPPSDPSVEPTATSTPSAETAAVLAGAGDIGDCSTEEDTLTGQVLASIDGTIFTVGDNAYENGSPAEYENCYDTVWGSFKDRTRPVPGNHDWRSDDLDGYFGYFGNAAKGPDGHAWYSFDVGSWHVIMLDSECDKFDGCGADSTQGRWLTADLAASDASCTVAMWHKPRFSSGDHGNDRSVAPFWTQLYDAGVDVIVNGHDHDYERFAPQDPSGKEDRERGMREFIVGTGGTQLRPFRDTKANSELRLLTHGVFKLTLRDGSYDWEFIPVAGDVTDTGTAFCH